MIKRLRCRGTTVAFAVLMAIAGSELRAQTLSLDLPAQSLDVSLREISRLGQINVLFDSKVVDGLNAPALRGTLTRLEAVRRLTQDTGLEVKQPNAGTITIGRVAKPQASALATGSGFRVAQATVVSETTHATNDDSVAGTTNSTVEEVVVTAQKREERLLDVPVPVTAISADRLANNNQLRLQDYYTSVPGLSAAPISSQSTQTLTIRGINTGVGTNPTVGITVDDVAYGASTGMGGSSLVPDFDPADLARVEVLRGPQGTLYGASSMGGQIKFVTVDPSTDALSGRVQAGLSSVSHGNDPGYSVRGSINVPLSETFALRASGFTREDAGYIDNPILGIDGINESRVHGGRLSGLWRPTDTVSLKLSALYQRSEADGSSDVTRQLPGGFPVPPLGDLEQSYLPGVGGYEQRAQAYSATLTAQLGEVALTAVSGYNVNAYNDSWDLTYALGSRVEDLYGVGGVPITDDNETRKFTQEIRFNGTFGEKFDWLAGGFYTHEDSDYIFQLFAANTATGAIVDQYSYSASPSSYREYAGFLNLTYHVTDRFDVQFGGRQSSIEVSTWNEGAGGVILVPKVTSDASAFTYLVTPRFKISPDVMVYARLASGYRAGGPNASPGVPRDYAPDKTKNYELGIKASVLDRRLNLDASLYRIDWNDIQLQLTDPDTFFSYLSNTSRARSQGVELTVEAHPLDGLTIAGWVAWNDAVVTEAFPPASEGGTAYAVRNSRLPYSSRMSGYLSLDKEFPVTSRATASVGGAVSYVDDRVGQFTATPVRQIYAGYAQLDLRSSLRYESWLATLFVNNVADKRAILAGGLGAFPPYGFTYIQPRTVGVSVARTF